ncbi:hypothetical protein DFJ73DRAFT_773440 [Zopfochytrium polystomum]|nr:hypothetical protein DFJ73DRAFT_773440 [Zopfochytrium polystomum]
MSSSSADNRKPIRFIIIGAGPGGLAAASSIRRHLQVLGEDDGRLPPVEYDVYEMKAHISEHTGVQYSLALGMGISEAIAPVVVPLSQVRYVYGDGAHIWQRIVPPGSDEGRYIPQVRRAALLEAMANTLPKGKIQYGKQVKGWRQWDDGCEVEFTDGSVSRGDFIIAGDGIYSQFRYSFYPNAHPTVTDVGSIYLYASVPKTANDPLSNKLRTMSTTGVSLTSLSYESCAGFFPLHNGDYCIFLELKKEWEEKNLPIGQSLEKTPFEKLRQIAIDMCVKDHAAHPELAKGFEYAVNSGYPLWRIKCLQPIPKTFHHRVLLIGDAAHAVIPYLGRGAVTSIEDGAQIGFALREGLLSGKDAQTVLAEYAKSRDPAVRGIFENAQKELDNWWAIGKRERPGDALVLATWDRARKAKASAKQASKL